VNNRTDYFIGIDGGGTKCKVRLEDANGNLIAETIAGPANAARDMKGSVESLLAATQMVIDASNVPNLSAENIHAGIGLAGLNIHEIKEAFEREALPFASTAITSDLHIACLGAHQGRDGAIVIAGTGSAGIAINGTQTLELGGHGFNIGDKSSGAWLGKMAISHTLETLDAIQAPNQLATEVMKKLNCNNAHAIVNLTLDAKSAFYATLAPLVLKLASEQQPDAIQLVTEGAEYLNKLTTQLLTLKPSRLSFIGGITHILIPYLAPQLQAQIEPALGSPEQGAIHYIKSQLTHRETL
jgi:glucosamine kinase